MLDARHSGGLASADLMNDESAPSPETSPIPDAAPRGRRVSNKHPQKPAKPAKAPVDPPQAPATEPETPANPPSSHGDWPDPEPASTGSSGHPENPKRKRRRKKGKGPSLHNAPLPAAAEESAPPTPNGNPNTAPAAAPPKAPAPRPERPPCAKPDPVLLAERAWKIYLAEISEEGVALVGESEAKELSRRCFRLAEIFLDEQAHRV